MIKIPVASEEYERMSRDDLLKTLVTLRDGFNSALDRIQELTESESEKFVLDRKSNPHPALLRLAIGARRRVTDTNHATQAYYLGVLHACCAATGCGESDVVGWFDAHEDVKRSNRPVTVTVTSNWLL